MDDKNIKARRDNTRRNSGTLKKVISHENSNKSGHSTGTRSLRRDDHSNCMI